MADGVTADVRLLANRYQIGELLGRGGMADVHVGIDARLGRRVAIKLLKPSLANDPAFRTRFRQEAQAAARMAHPTIVRVFDAGEETVRDPSGHEIQVPFIVMEHVDGRLLKDVVAEGPLDPAEAGRIVDGILVALEYSHRAGVVHRDIKPGNVMVTSAGQVKVMDFGIARADLRLVRHRSRRPARSSARPQYFSPEQARGEAVDARTDLYSTGVVLYELLVGRPPFQGETAVADRLPARQRGADRAERAQPRRLARAQRRRHARARQGPHRALPVAPPTSAPTSRSPCAGKVPDRASASAPTSTPRCSA